MAYKYSFADNETYSATDLNEITKRLVTSGVEDAFSDGVAYNVSRFNEAGKLLYTSGVVPETCMTLKVVPNGDGKVLINSGRAFFNDGAVIEIQVGGESLEYVVGARNYVYLKNDLLNKNECFPCCTTEEPTGDFVLLAEIDESGEIFDKRTYAKGKLPGYQSYAENVLRIKETLTFTLESSEKNLYETLTFDLGPNNFEYIMTYREYGVGEDGRTYNSCLGVYDIANNRYRSLHTTDTTKDDEKLMIQSSWEGISWKDERAFVTFELIDNILTVSFQAIAVDRFSAGTHSFDIDLILF